MYKDRTIKPRGMMLSSQPIVMSRLSRGAFWGVHTLSFWPSGVLAVSVFNLSFWIGPRPHFSRPRNEVSLIYRQGPPPFGTVCHLRWLGSFWPTKSKDAPSGISELYKRHPAPLDLKLSCVATPLSRVSFLPCV
jgi:hypothetical protein